MFDPMMTPPVSPIKSAFYTDSSSAVIILELAWFRLDCSEDDTTYSRSFFNCYWRLIDCYFTVAEVFVPLRSLSIFFIAKVVACIGLPRA